MAQVRYTEELLLHILYKNRFIEVKYRKDRRSGSSFAAVGKQKQRTILKVALFYLIRNGFQDDIPCRFDVVGIDGEEIRWIKNAFEYRQR